MPSWLVILQGLLTPMIAIVTTYIAVQQYRASMLKMRIDRYDRMLKIYQETHKFITLVTSESDLEIRQLFEFETATAEADFIFPPEIRVYLNEIFTRANKLRVANRLYDKYESQVTPPRGYDHEINCETMHEHLMWFTDQPQVAKNKFKPYMDLT